MPTWPTHWTHEKLISLLGVMCLVELQQHICNLVLLMFIYLIAYIYALFRAIFVKSEEIIGFYLQMWICSLSYISFIILTSIVFFFIKIAQLLSWPTFMLHFPLYYICIWMFQTIKFFTKCFNLVILWVCVFYFGLDGIDTAGSVTLF